MIWEFCGVVADNRSGKPPWDDVVVGLDRMAPPDPKLGPRWFPGARLNFAENLLRYADDLCLAARDKTSLKRLMSVARDQLRQLRLEFGHWPQPTSLDEGVEWLGVRLRRTTHPWDRSQTVGYEIPLPKIKHLFEVIDEMTEPPSDRLHGNVFRLGSWVTSLNEQLHQWFEVYGGATNAPEVFRALDEHLKHRFSTLLREVTGARGRQVAERHRRNLPRGFWTWEVEGSSLVCLPSLAPRCPFRFPRRPPWKRG